jgi:hypothetical protein
MNTKDLPVVILGAGVLYMAYLLQNNRLRLGFEGFQDSAPPMMPPAPPTPPASAAMPPAAMPPADMPPADMPPAAMPPADMPPAPMPPAPMPPASTMDAGSMPPASTIDAGSMPNAPASTMTPQKISQLADNMKRMRVTPDILDSVSQQMKNSQAAGSEGFQSYQNPYNYSPITQQTYEFRLGNRALVKDVIGGMHN